MHTGMCTLSVTVIEREKKIRTKGLGFITLPLWPYPFQLLYSTTTTSLISPTATAADRPLITNLQPPTGGHWLPFIPPSTLPK